MGTLDNNAAYDLFYDETAAVGGVRLETGAASTRAALQAVPCCVFGGEMPDPANDAIMPGDDCGFRVWIRKNDWLDHTPPQRGDTLTIEGRPVMRVVNSQFDSTDWILDCRGKLDG